MSRLPKNESETSLGGNRRDFPATTWGMVAGVRDDASPRRREALENLCLRYWKPVYHAIRAAWSKDNEAAKDLTQAFFLSLLEGDALRRYAPERGSFRAYLKGILRNFAADRHDLERALKRGGGTKTLSLEGLPKDPGSIPPDALFERAWKKEVFERALDAARRWFSCRGREIQFRVLEAIDLAANRPTYAQVAERLSLTEAVVRNYLFLARERVRTEVRAELSDLVTDPQTLEEEWNAFHNS
ncbi:MAG: sigma-70 family RNA polymerase sigma factor [Planctomycetes bacterium]|nr:sigma-70 family RNA polymerase sigma factor [Planctomycetota bacterium]